MFAIRVLEAMVLCESKDFPGLANKVKKVLNGPLLQKETYIYEREYTPSVPRYLVCRLFDWSEICLRIDSATEGKRDV